MPNEEYDPSSKVNYDPQTGIFTWVDNGKVAGGYTPKGYIKIKVAGYRTYAHRLAWFMVHGEWPKGQIDHINRVKDDNRIDNLRDVTQRENNQNKETFNGGCHFNRQNQKWRSYIYSDNKQNHLGYFETQEEAKQAYSSALNKL